MKKTFLKVLAIALVVVSVFLTCACAFASSSDEVINEEPPVRYSVIDSASLTFSISGVTANCGAALTAQKSTSLQIVMTLQKKTASNTYTNVKTWSKTGTGVTLTLAKSKTINPLSNYRLKATFTAGGETTTIYRYH